MTMWSTSATVWVVTECEMERDRKGNKPTYSEGKGKSTCLALMVIEGGREEMRRERNGERM